MISNKHKNVCKILNYIKHLLILACTVIECASISAFSSLIGISSGIARFAATKLILI